MELRALVVKTWRGLEIVIDMADSRWWEFGN